MTYQIPPNYKVEHKTEKHWLYTKHITLLNGHPYDYTIVHHQRKDAYSNLYDEHGTRKQVTMSKIKEPKIVEKETKITENQLMVFCYLAYPVSVFLSMLIMTNNIGFSFNQIMYIFIIGAGSIMFYQLRLMVAINNDSDLNGIVFWTKKVMMYDY